MSSGTVFWFFVLIWMLLCEFSSEFDSEVLWKNCQTTICGTRPLTIYCGESSAILIDSVSSGKGTAFDRRSYVNLRRMCNGMSKCNPSGSMFCQSHQDVNFNVNYICIRDIEVEKGCETLGKSLTGNKGFIMSPNYPAQSNSRNCKWRIGVPEGHFLHIVLHEVLPISPSDCGGGLIFTTDSLCPEKTFPSDAVCDEAEVNTTIASCGDTSIDMVISKSDSMRFWLSYYVVPIDDLRYVTVYDVDIACMATGMDTYVIDPAYYQRGNTTVDERNVTKANTTEVIATSTSKDTEEEDDTAIYIGIAIAIIALIAAILIALVLVYIRRRRKLKQTNDTKTGAHMKHSSSQTSDIQKRPLPERKDKVYTEDKEGQPILNEGYSRVADEVQPGEVITESQSSPTYAEIEDCTEPINQRKKVITNASNKPSFDSLKRKLPAKPKEATRSTAVPPKEKEDPHNSIYFEIEDPTTVTKSKETQSTPAAAKTTDPQSNNPLKNKPIFSRLARYQSNIEKNNESDAKFHLPQRKSGLSKEAESHYNDIYTECDDVIDDANTKRQQHQEGKPYMDMKSIPNETKGYPPQAKGMKDQANLSRRKNMGPQNVYEDVPNECTGSKKESVTSGSDSDDSCIVENDLYEPFESAKV